MRAWTIALILTACGGATPSAPPPKDRPAPTGGEPEGAEADLVLTTSDGVELAASYRPSATGEPRCVVLLHQLSSTRAEWAPVIEALSDRWHVLALDMRGHGASTRKAGGDTLAWKSFQPADWAAVVEDLEATRAFFTGLGIGTDSCVYVGSSIGATAVLRFVGKYFDAAGIVLLSPGVAYRGLDVMPAAKQYGGPKLVVHSGESEDAGRALEQVWTTSKTLPQPQAVTRRVVPGNGHGMKMTADDPELVGAIAAFVDGVLAALPEEATDGDPGATAP